MAEYWLNMEIVTDLPVADVVRIAALVAQLVDGETDVAVTSCDVRRWDEDDDGRHAELVPLGAEGADPDA